MKILIIYFSLSGHTKWAAEVIAAAGGGELLEIKTAKQLPGGKLTRHFWGGKQVFTGEKPEILPLAKNVGDYDFIFIGTPVWAFSYAPALKTFFEHVKVSGKKIALFLTCDGMPGKTLINMKKALTGNEIAGELSLVSPFKNKSANQDKINVWARQLINNRN